MYAVNDGSIGAAQVGLVAFAVDDNSVSIADGSGATAVIAQATTFPAAASAQIVSLGHEFVSKVKVHSTSAGGTVYTEGTDYCVDFQAGLVMLIAGGGIAAGATAYIDYSWAHRREAPRGESWHWILSGQVWIDFWHQSVNAV